MFENASQQLQHARVLLDGLCDARDERDFLERFNGFVGAAQSVLIAVLREGRGERLAGFAEWYAARRDEMDRDLLMLMVREARDFDFDDGPHRLRFVTSGTGDERLAADDQGRPPKPGAWLSLPAAPSVHAAVDNAPGTHLGRQLERTDPAELCEAVYRYLENLLADAAEAVG